MVANRFVVAVALAVSLFEASAARAQDASLTVYLKNSGVGNFGQTNSLSSQVHVFAQSGFQAQYNGSTNIYAPAFGSAAPGSTFSVTVPNLTSSAKQSFNNYFLNLDWPDTQHHNVQLGPFKVAPGNNNYGAGGLGSVTPIDVANLAPPAVTNPMCYADQPSPSTSLYTYWSFGWPNRFEDFNVTEVHMSTTQGFTPSQQNLIALNPYGTDYRKVGNLVPNTSYYFCVRVIDEYSAYSDTCFGPCKTMPASPPPDLAMMPVPDMAVTPPPDMTVMPDMSMMAPDLAMTPPDLATTPIDMTAVFDLSMMQSPDLAMMAMRNDLSMGSDSSIGLNGDANTGMNADGNTGMNGDANMAMNMDMNTTDDAGTATNRDEGIPMDADVDAFIAGNHGKDVGGCGCSLRRTRVPREALAMLLVMGLLVRRRRRQ